MINCPICGSEFNPYTAGRTKTYCSSLCGDYFKFRNALEKNILSLKLDSAHLSIIRGDMFRLANLLSCRTKRHNIQNKDKKC